MSEQEKSSWEATLRDKYGIPMVEAQEDAEGEDECELHAG